KLHSKHFVMGRDADVYMYSAIVNLPENNIKDNHFDPSTNAEIIITTLDRSSGSFYCCVLFDNKKTLLRNRGQIYFENYVKSGSLIDSLTEYFFPRYYIARQFRCRVPTDSPRSRYSYISLASSRCSTDRRDFLPILQPSRVPGGLALCAKVAHSGGLDPEKVIEWFEVQQLLGVDKVLIFDLGNPETLNRPPNRSLGEKWKRTSQFHHDETMAVLECRQRLAGYDYIIGHDTDEFIIPRRAITLKDFLKEQLQKEPKAAGFYLYTQFFITTWKPTNPEEDLMVKRYRESTVPLWEAYKYVYLPSRAKIATTHQFFPKDAEFRKCKVSPEAAVLHHYRECPQDTWGTCSVATHTDNIMARYHDLDERVFTVRNATQTLPKWTAKHPYRVQ
ncbi:unnamed protein product, partial [Candidula unifasciata]